MNFKRFASFLRIAEAGSLTRAADKLRIAQPALSRQMRLLEDELGVVLFERHHRGLLLTEAGEELRRRLSSPMRELDQVFEDVKALNNVVRGTCVFGMPPSVGYVLAAPLALGIARFAPQISLRIVEAYDAHLIDWLHRGEIDAALIYGPASNLQLPTEEVLVEELRLVGPQGSKLDSQQPVAFSALAELMLVLPSNPHGLRSVVESAAAKARVSLNVACQADSFTLMKQLVESGMYYTLLPLSACSREVRAGRLVWAPIEKPKLTRQIVLADQPDRKATRASRVFRSFVRGEISNLVSSGAWNAHLMFQSEQASPLSKPS